MMDAVGRMYYPKNTFYFKASSIGNIQQSLTPKTFIK